MTADSRNREGRSVKKKAKALPKPASNDPAAVVPSDAPAITTDLPAGVTVVRGPDGQEASLQFPGRSPENVFRDFGGSDRHQFNSALLREVLGCVSMPVMPGDPNAKGRAATAVMAALAAFKPQDAIEGMLAGQAVALHFASMEALRMAMIPEQPADMAAKLRKDAANMMRAMTEMLEALDRKRGKGPQVVRVERVIVHEGGQAVVGNVHPGLGGGG